MAAAVEQVTVSISHVSESAASARSLAEETGNLSTEGKDSVQNTIGEINKIADSVSKSSEVIHTLGEQSNKISSIVNVIKEIADQTKASRNNNMTNFTSVLAGPHSSSRRETCPA